MKIYLVSAVTNGGARTTAISAAETFTDANIAAAAFRKQWRIKTGTNVEFFVEEIEFLQKSEGSEAVMRRELDALIKRRVLDFES